MKSLIEGYYSLLRHTLTVLMALIIVPVVMQIISRYTGIFPRYIWTEEIARFCFVWIVMIGAMIAVRDSSHFDVDLLKQPKTKRSQGVRNLIVHLPMVVMSAYFTIYGCKFAQFGFMQTSEMSGINMLSIYIAFPIAGITWLIFLAEKIAEDVRLIRNPNQEIDQ